MRTSDWVVIGMLCLISLAVGLLFSSRSSKGGAAGYFIGGRDVPWWAIGLSNTATYQSGNGRFVTLVLVFGLAGNWLWWSSCSLASVGRRRAHGRGPERSSKDIECVTHTTSIGSLGCSA